MNYFCVFRPILQRYIQLDVYFTQHNSIVRGKQVFFFFLNIRFTFFKTALTMITNFQRYKNDTF